MPNAITKYQEHTNSVPKWLAQSWSAHFPYIKANQSARRCITSRGTARAWCSCSGYEALDVSRRRRRNYIGSIMLVTQATAVLSIPISRRAAYLLPWRRPSEHLSVLSFQPAVYCIFAVCVAVAHYPGGTEHRNKKYLRITGLCCRWLDFLAEFFSTKTHLYQKYGWYSD